MTLLNTGKKWSKKLAGTIVGSSVVFAVQTLLTFTLNGDATRVQRECTSDPVTVKAEACRFYERALQSARQGRYSEAASDYSESIRLDPTFAPAYLNRAWSLGQMGQLDRMVADCTEAIALDRSSALAYAHRAWAYAKLNQNDLAALDRDEAIRLDPSLAKSTLILSSVVAIQSGRGLRSELKASAVVPDGEL